MRDSDPNRYREGRRIQIKVSVEARFENDLYFGGPWIFCAPGRSRTRNLTGRNRLLYPVELQGRLVKRTGGRFVATSPLSLCAILEGLGGRSSVG